jgi:hypothetical protein
MYASFRGENHPSEGVSSTKLVLETTAGNMGTHLDAKKDDTKRGDGR